MLLLQPISPDAVAPVVEKAKEKGIVVVTCASPVGTDQYDASVLAKDEDFGRAGMEWLCKELNGKGQISVECQGSQSQRTVRTGRKRY